MINEKEIMDIIVNGGDARSSSIKALKLAREGHWEEAEKLMERAKENLTKAHNVQTKLIQSEIRGEGIEISLLMVHAQDHLMNAITVMDLTSEMLQDQKKIRRLEKMIQGVTINV